MSCGHYRLVSDRKDLRRVGGVEHGTGADRFAQSRFQVRAGHVESPGELREVIFRKIRGQGGDDLSRIEQAGPPERQILPGEAFGLRQGIPDAIGGQTGSVEGRHQGEATIS